MGKFWSYSWILVLFALTSCAEEAQEYKAKTIHLYSDFLSEADEVLFSKFERKERINVEVHRFPFDSLERLLTKEKWNAGIDMVLLSSPILLRQLADRKMFYVPKERDSLWVPLTCDPYVFYYPPADSLGQLRSYGQLFASDAYFMQVDTLKNESVLQPFYLGLNQLYTKISRSQLKKRVVSKDSVLDKNQSMVAIGLHSQFVFDNEHWVVYPDQFFRGAIANTNGLAMLKYGFNTDASIRLLEFCKNEKWKKSAAQQWNQFPILKERELDDLYLCPIVLMPNLEKAKE